MTDSSNGAQQRFIVDGVTIVPGPPVSGTLCFGIPVYDDFRSEPDQPVSGRTISEIDRVEAEMAFVEEEIRSMGDMLRSEGFEAESDILLTHLLILQDNGLKNQVRERIEKYNDSAESAVSMVFDQLKEKLKGSENDIIKERSADFEDLQRQISKRLYRHDSQGLLNILKNADKPVLALPELFVSHIISVRDKGVQAVIVDSGTPLSHAAIISKAFGIPVLRISDIENLRDHNGSHVVVQSDRGKLIINPDKEDYAASSSSGYQLTTNNALQSFVSSPVSIWLNIIDGANHLESGVDLVAGVGLYRSEFILTQSESGFPSEEQQFESYHEVCTRWGHSPVTIRTFDIGGDKILPYFFLGSQENPYLGLRAHRIYRYHPELLFTQMRAILRAGVGCSELRILYPMIETVEQLQFIQKIVDDAVKDLEQENVSFTRRFKQGVLVEVPSLVWVLPELLEKVDFISVGTNDLLQYHFAVDRGNANVDSIYEPTHPSSLRLLKRIAETAEKYGKPVTICGEIAADPKMVPLLVGLGYLHLSIDIHFISKVHQALAALSESECRLMADRCLSVSTREEVTNIMSEYNVTEHKLEGAGETTESELRNIPSLGSVDPVCKMIIDRDTAPFSFLWKDKRYYFCSEGCRNSFAEAPEKYI